MLCQRTGRDGEKYGFIKDEHKEHADLHQDNGIKNLFHRHYELGRPVEFLDIKHCLKLQRDILLLQGLEFEDYDYDSLAFEYNRKKEGFEKLPPHADTTLITMLKRQNPLFFGECSESWKVNALMEIRTPADKLFAKKLQTQLKAGMFYHKETLFMLPYINEPARDGTLPSLGQKIQNLLTSSR